MFRKEYPGLKNARRYIKLGNNNTNITNVNNGVNNLVFNDKSD